MIRIVIFLSLLFASAWTAPTLNTMKQEHRVALVIGNSDYDDHSITVAVQNARQIKKFLEKNGFYVYYGENLDKKNFVRLLRKFNKNLHPNGIGLVYYSGHSVQTRGKNYLIPIDSGILNESMIVSKGIALDSIYSGMEGSYNRLNIVLLDSAFDAPFGTLFKPKKRGLAAIRSPKAQVTFSAVQPDSVNVSTTFTDDFLHLADQKGIELSELQEKLVDLRKKHHQTKPYITIAKNQPFYFLLPDHIPEPDELAYLKIKQNPSKSDLEKFINHYPNSAFTAKAKELLHTITLEEAARQEKERRALEAKAAEAMQKAKEAAAKQAEEKALAEKALAEQTAAEEKRAREQAEAEAAKQKNDIDFRLTDPDDVVTQEPVKPKEGEERQILLE